MRFPWKRDESLYDFISELNRIEMAIEWRTDQIRLLYKSIDFLREHKLRIADKRDQAERHQRRYHS